MAINYSLGDGKETGKPKTFKAPGAIKRLFTNKDKAKFDSGEKDEYLDTKKKTYSVKTGKNIVEPGHSETKTTKYQISPAEKGSKSYTPGRAFTKSAYPETSSPETQAGKAGKPKTAYGKMVEDGYQSAVKDQKDTYSVTHPKTKETNIFKAGTTTSTPDKPAVYGEKTQTLSQDYEMPEVKKLDYGKGHLLKPKKVINVEGLWGKGYNNKNSQNLLNSQKKKR